MCDASEIHCCRIPFAAVFLAFLCLLPATAQRSKEPSLPKYDLHTETKMKVTVDEVKLPPKGSEKDGAHLLVKSGTDSVDVNQRPQSFFDDMGISFSKGDEVTLTGSKVKTRRGRPHPCAGSGERQRYIRHARRERESRLELNAI